MPKKEEIDWFDTITMLLCNNRINFNFDVDIDKFNNLMNKTYNPPVAKGDKIPVQSESVVCVNSSQEQVDTCSETTVSGTPLGFPKIWTFSICKYCDVEEKSLELSMIRDYDIVSCCPETKFEKKKFVSLEDYEKLKERLNKQTQLFFNCDKERVRLEKELKEYKKKVKKTIEKYNKSSNNIEVCNILNNILVDLKE